MVVDLAHMAERILAGDRLGAPRASCRRKAEKTVAASHLAAVRTVRRGTRDREIGSVLTVSRLVERIDSNRQIFQRVEPRAQMRREIALYLGFLPKIMRFDLATPPLITELILL